MSISTAFVNLSGIFPALPSVAWTVVAAERSVAD